MGAHKRPFATSMFAMSVLLAIHVASWLFPSVPELMRASVADRLFKLRPGIDFARPSYDETVAHVAIDDSSLEQIGTPYLGRTDYARLVRNLGRAGVAAQLHDAVYVAPLSEREDRELIDATKEAGNVYYGVALGLSRSAAGAPPRKADEEASGVLDRDRWRLQANGASFPSATGRSMTFPALALAAGGLGFLDITADPDGVYRRAPLLGRDGDGYFLSLPMRAVCDYLGVGPEQVDLAPGRITLRDARRPGAEATEDIRIPVDDRGRVIVNFLGPWGAMKHYPFFAVWEASDDRFMMEDLRDELEGKVVVVSWVKTGAGDVGPVPTDPQYPLSGIHASVAHSILTGNFLREASSLTMLLAVEIPLLVIFVVLALRFTMIPFISLSAGFTALYVVIGTLAFLKGNLILDIPRPILLAAVTTLVLTAYHYHLESEARAVLRGTFEAYFPASVVDKVTARPDRLLSTASKKELTILFSDIEGFTSRTSKMEPEAVRELLNEYFERMIDVVFEHGGTLDKFIGDGLMVFFGDPETQADHAARGIQTAVAMQRAARELARSMEARGDQPFRIRVGLHSGEVIVGNMGSSRRVSYTALGEPVNLAQRLESHAPSGGILISARTRELSGDAIESSPREPIRVKGFADPIEVHEIVVDE